MNKLQVGQVDRNRNGSDYIVKSTFSRLDVKLERISDGWTLVAHGILMYPDGTIEWDYSTGGHWVREGRW